MAKDLVDRFCDSVLPLMVAAADGKRTRRLIGEVVKTDIFNSFDKFHETTDTIVKAFNEAGAVGQSGGGFGVSSGCGAEVYEIPTGGEMGSGRWIIQEAQDFRAATLSVVSPVRKKVADYAKNPWHVIQWTASTPVEGMTCEVVVCDDFEEMKKLNKGAWEGKVLLTKASLYRRMLELARLGVRGVICDRPAPNAPDALTWNKFGWGGKQIDEAAVSLVGMVVSENQGKYLRKLCKENQSVKVKMVVDAPCYVGSHDMIHATVQGREADAKEVWAIAHTAEPGACDNASGVAACVEILRLLEKLIGAGKIERPRRTIRLLVGYECYSFFHFLEHGLNGRQPLAGVCLDEVGTKVSEINGRLEWHATVPTSAGFVDGLGERILRRTMKMMDAGYRIIPSKFVSTLDTLIGDPEYGFPCPWLTSGYPKNGRPFDAYHTSADVLGLIGEKELKACVGAMAGYLYYLADMGEAEVKELVEGAGGDAVKVMGKMKGKVDKREMDYAIDGYEANVKRLGMWVNGKAKKEVGAMAAEQRRAVQQAAKVVKVAKNGKRKAVRGSGKVPVRLVPVTPTLENVHRVIGQRIAESGLRDWALFWADGQRTIGQIAERLRCEYGKDVDLTKVVDFFDAHAELGYVRYKK